jgi:hypothetical protein
MKTEREIKDRLDAIDRDERFHCEAATVFENAPLALIQTGMESEARALAWVLGVAPPKPGPKRRKP